LLLETRTREHERGVDQVAVGSNRFQHVLGDDEIELFLDRERQLGEIEGICCQILYQESSGDSESSATPRCSATSRRTRGSTRFRILTCQSKSLRVRLTSDFLAHLVNFDSRRRREFTRP